MLSNFIKNISILKKFLFINLVVFIVIGSLTVIYLKGIQPNLINKKTWGDIYKPSEITTPLLNIDPVDLRNSPDYTLLYGVKVKDCIVRIHYEDNRRKGRSWDIPLKNNMFIMFPSTNMYYLTNNQKDSLNFVQTITYEYI